MTIPAGVIDLDDPALPFGAARDDNHPVRDDGLGGLDSKRVALLHVRRGDRTNDVDRDGRTAREGDRDRALTCGGNRPRGESKRNGDPHDRGSVSQRNDPPKLKAPNCGRPGTRFIRVSAPRAPLATPRACLFDIWRVLRSLEPARCDRIARETRIPVAGKPLGCASCYRVVSIGFVLPHGVAWPKPVSIPGVPAAYDVADVVGHNDLTPENVIFVRRRPAGIIDFDLAAPSTRTLDVVTTLLWWAPLREPMDRDPRRTYYSFEKMTPEGGAGVTSCVGVPQTFCG